MAGESIYYDRATVFAQLGVFREPVGWFGQLALMLNHPLLIGVSAVRMLWKQSQGAKGLDRIPG